MPQISTIIITLNEEDNIKDCLESVKWSDEIIVIDSGSTDKTVEIARTYTDIVFTQKLSYAGKRNYGIDKASCDWIFWLDADERVTEELKKEILNLLKSTPDIQPTQHTPASAYAPAG